MCKLKNFWKFYVKGEYHCDSCPFCWGGGYLPGCDDYDDCGCYIKGDIADKSCRLIPPIRFLLGWGKRKKARYYENHRYDDYEDFMQMVTLEENAVEDALNEYLKNHGYGITYASDGKVLNLNNNYETISELRDIYMNSEVL